MRAAMGAAVFGGMLGVTLFGLFLTPIFYVVLRRLTGNRPLRQHDGATVHPAAEAVPITLLAAE
jgi:multidrug efflux pump